MPGCEAIQDQEGSNLGISDPQNLSLPLVIATHPPPETPTCCRNSWRRLTEADLPHQISEAGCGRGDLRPLILLRWSLDTARVSYALLLIVSPASCSAEISPPLSARVEDGDLSGDAVFGENLIESRGLLA